MRVSRLRDSQPRSAQSIGLYESKPCDQRHRAETPVCASHVALDWLSWLIQLSAIERKLRVGQFLFTQGHPTSGLYEVVRGTLRLVRFDAAGREAVLRVACGGDTLAEASLFSPTHHCDAIATTSAVVRVYQKAAVLAELQRNPDAAHSFMALLARQIMELGARLERRNILSARDRVRHYLGAEAGMEVRTVVLPGTVKDLATELGLTHEALYRTLAEMEADGEIARLKGRIRVAAYDRDHS